MRARRVALHRLGLDRRHAAVGRIDDDRRAPLAVDDDRRVAAVDPEVVVAADVARGARRAVAADRRCVASCRCSAAPRGRDAAASSFSMFAASASVMTSLFGIGPLEGRQGGGVVQPLQVRIPLRRPELGRRPPAAWQPGVWPATETDKSDATATAAPRAPTTVRNRARIGNLRVTVRTCLCRDPPILPGERVLAPLSVHQLLDELHALELHQLRVSLDPAVERHADLPGLREGLRVLDRGLVRRWSGPVRVYRSTTCSWSLWWLPARSNQV